MRAFLRDVRWAYGMSRQFWPNGHVRRVLRYSRLRWQVTR